MGRQFTRVICAGEADREAIQWLYENGATLDSALGCEVIGLPDTLRLEQDHMQWRYLITSPNFAHDEGQMYVEMEWRVDAATSVLTLKTV